MIITIKKNREEILQAVCNCCGKRLPVENGMVQEDYLHVDKTWGYFSEEDGENDVFDLCEACTKELMSRFRIPAYHREAREMI